MNRTTLPGFVLAALLLTSAAAARAQSEPEVPPAPSVPAPPEELPLATPPEEAHAHDTAPPRELLPSALGPFAGALNPVLGFGVPRVDYRATWIPSEHVEGQPADLGFWQHDFSASAPVWHDGPDLWAVSAHVRAEVFHTDAILPDSGRPFPDELWNIRAGTTYSHLFDNGWTAGATVNVGSASDKPFHGIREMTAGVSAFLRVPQGEHNAWLFSLHYSANSELPIPIPGVAFLWQPSDCFRMNVGLPFLVMVRPCEDLTLDLSYMLITNVHARATYRLCPAWKVYAGFDWNNEGYFLADRLDDRERFFYFEKRLTAGVQTRVGHAVLDFSGGYVFDRMYFEGRNYRDRSHDRVDVGDGPFGAVRAELRF